MTDICSQPELVPLVSSAASLCFFCSLAGGQLTGFIDERRTLQVFPPMCLSLNNTICGVMYGDYSALLAACFLFVSICIVYIQWVCSKLTRQCL